jgi:hypothetical protein
MLEGPSSNVEERSFDRISGQYPTAIRSLAAGEAQWCPRHGSEPLQADFLLAIEARSERTERDSTECSSHFAQPCRVTLEIANRHVAFRGVLDLVKHFRTGIECNHLAVPQQVLQLG